MAVIPQEKSLDSALDVLKDGFEFIQKRCRQHGSDIFRTRLLFKDTICMSGEAAAQIFYDPERFVRHGAIPKPIQKTLLGERSIMTTDDAMHRRRKEMFMSVMNPGSIQKLMDEMTEQWQTAISRWEQQPKVVLFDETQEILFRSACAWAGVPLDGTDVRSRTKDFATMVDAFGSAGPRHFRGRWARQRSETWMQEVIGQIRDGRLLAPQHTPAHAVAFYKEIDGQPLDTKLAAVELINLIRPIVAISWYITFAALALHEYPNWRNILQQGKQEELNWFVDEVRRFYPFAPFTGARVRTLFRWHGYMFQPDTLVLLDIYGTNRDPRIWDLPNEFWPGRFKNWQGDRFRLIPQGGGDYLTGHRCAGEWITIETTKLAVRFLTTYIDYDVPKQDLSYSLSRMPTMPRSYFIIQQVRKRPASKPEEFVSPEELPLEVRAQV
jgi:fatty-acid peroxygenase